MNTRDKARARRTMRDQLTEIVRARKRWRCTRLARGLVICIYQIQCSDGVTFNHREVFDLNYLARGREWRGYVVSRLELIEHSTQRAAARHEEPRP